MATKKPSTEKPRKTPHQRIIAAAQKGAGVRLSADEVFYLSKDDAISTRAECDDLNDEGVPDEQINHGWE